MEGGINRFDELICTFTDEGSWWQIIGVESLKLCTAIYEPRSLDVLSKNLANEDNSKFNHLRRLYTEEDKFELLLRKGVYPYEYMDSFERLSDYRRILQQSKRGGHK